MALGTFFLAANKRWNFRFALLRFPLFAFAVAGLGLRQGLRVTHLCKSAKNFDFCRIVTKIADLQRFSDSRKVHERP
jgi:hypothetical protein